MVNSQLVYNTCRTQILETELRLRGDSNEEV